MSEYVFRQLTASEEEAAYQVICDTVDWLKEKKIQLWDKPLPREIYARRHEKGENYGLFVDQALAVVVSLVAGIPGYWAGTPTQPNAVWICTLAAARDFRGQSLGRTAVEMATDYVSQDDVYLDCKPGYLEGFYSSLGFQKVTHSSFPEYGFEAVLMHFERQFSE